MSECQIWLYLDLRFQLIPNFEALSEPHSQAKNCNFIQAFSANKPEVFALSRLEVNIFH